MRALAFLALLAAARARVVSAQDPSDVEAVVSTDLGYFRIGFFPDKAPKHVAQFLTDVQKGYYDGSAFFRVWANGLIQGGDPLLKDSSYSAVALGHRPIQRASGRTPDLKQERGMLSAVNLPGKPNSDGSEFFVCVSPQPALQGKYTVFARVAEGPEQERFHTWKATITKKPQRWEESTSGCLVR